MARTPLINRVPEIWRRLDVNQVMERYFNVLDDGFDRTHDLAEALFALRSVDKIADRWLDLLGPTVGHRWRSDKDRPWNRRKTRDAIRLWSYKGSYNQLSDMIRDCGGGDEWSVIDMASRLATFDLQGGLGDYDGYFEAADYYHDGAFVLLTGLETDLAELRRLWPDFEPSGTRWYLVLVEPWDDVAPERFMPTIQASRGSWQNPPAGVLPLVDAWITADSTAVIGEGRVITMDDALHSMDDPVITMDTLVDPRDPTLTADMGGPG